MENQEGKGQMSTEPEREGTNVHSWTINLLPVPVSELSWTRLLSTAWIVHPEPPNVSADLCQASRDS